MTEQDAGAIAEDVRRSQPDVLFVAISSPRKETFLAAWRSRDQLGEQLYTWGAEIESNAIDVHIHHLRRKLAPDLIRTVRGVGYLMPGDRHA